jgi:hypothetical protein
VLVTIEGVEYPGEVLLWHQREDGARWANVNRSRETQQYVDTVPAEGVGPGATNNTEPFAHAESD